MSRLLRYPILVTPRVVAQFGQKREPEFLLLAASKGVVILTPNRPTLSDSTTTTTMMQDIDMVAEIGAGNSKYLLGMTLDDNTDMSLPVVEDIQPDGPAARAGLQRGDLIREVDGQTRGNSNSTLSYLRKCQRGQVVRLRVTRRVNGAVGEDADAAGGFARNSVSYTGHRSTL